MFPRVKRSGKYEYLQIVENRWVDGQGRPVCCELWPGNTADVTTLVLKAELFERLDQRSLTYEWDDIGRDLDALQETELTIDDATYFL